MGFAVNVVRAACQHLQHGVRAARVLVHFGLGVDHVALRCMEVREHLLGTL